MFSFFNIAIYTFRKTSYKVHVMQILLPLLTLIFLFKKCKSSAGDRSPYFQKCVRRCIYQNCTDDGLNYINYKSFDLLFPSIPSILQWSCKDDCFYNCMWRTVDAFHERSWRTPQFFGKWPFIRVFNIQEPASVLFSILNLYAHFKMIRKFQKLVPSKAPLYWMWHFFSLVNINGWIWSIIFHCRDFPFTELMDYIGAFSIILISCYCMIVRLLRKIPKFFLIVITTFFLAFFINHAAYLSLGKFDYGYNMEVNIIIGTFTAISWFAWCTYNRLRQPYVWKCAVFVSLMGFAMLLEVMDQPPIFWIFDCHSLWHLSTIPLTYLFYSFIIDDSIYLNKITKYESNNKNPKKE